MRLTQRWAERVMAQIDLEAHIVEAQEDIIDGQTKLIESLLESFRHVMTESQRQKASALFYRVEETNGVITGLRKQFKLLRKP